MTTNLYQNSDQQYQNPTIPVPPRSTSEGSALLLTLIVVSLMLVVVLSFVVFVRMELRNITARQDLLLARANARVGALIALGRLQQAAGPDTRVTALADILSDTNPDDPDTGVTPFNADEQTRFWTGVWDTTDWNPGDPADRQGRFLRWLVSLPSSNSGVFYEERINSVNGSAMPFDLTDDDEFLTLANIQAIPFAGGAPVENEIRAGIKPVFTPNPLTGALEETGAFAWWVSDEGVKANPALTDPYSGEQQGGLLGDLPRFMFPHRENFSATKWFQNTDFENTTLVQGLRRASILPGSTDLAFSMSNFNISPEAENALLQDDLFADYSLYTHGVLSSTRRGGLRKDLSLLFWRDTNELAVRNPAIPFTNTAFENDFRFRRIFNYQDYPQPEQTIRSPAAATKRFFAPRWEVLRDFHNGFQRLADPNTESARLVPFKRTDPNGSVSDDFHTVISSGAANGGMFQGYSHFDTHDRYAPDDPAKETYQNRDGTGNLIDKVTNGFTPILLRWSMRYEIGFIPKVDGSGNPVLDSGGAQIYHPEMRMIPTVVLWNPYNVAISFWDQDSGSYLNPMGLKWNAQGTGRFNFTFEIENVNDGNTSTYRTAEGAEEYRLFKSDTFWLEFNEIDPALNEFKPGEVKVYMINGAFPADDVSWQQSQAINTSSTFPPADSYLSLSERFREDSDMEFLSGEPFAITTSVNFGGDGPRPAFTVGGTVQDYRLTGNDTDPDNPHLISGTVSDANTYYVGTLDLHMLPGPPEANHELNPRRFADFNIRSIYPKGGYNNAYGGKLPNAWIGFISQDIDVEKYASGPGAPMIGYWGNASGATGQSVISMFEVPRRPPESIGYYQQANLGWIHPNVPTYPLGNSLAHPHINRSYAVDFNNNRTLLDLSWLLNDSIWDDYFLSTIDPYDIDGVSPPRLAPLRERFVELDETVVYDETGGNPDELDYSEVAGNLLLQGAFNINSTSAEAWASFLASLSGEGIRYLAPGSASFETTNDLDYPFFRHTVPIGPEDTPLTGGPRNLSRSQIRTLAEHMVDEVKARGPFLSLSDFVNRRLSSDDRGLSGAIQSAIDRERADLQDVIIGDVSAKLSGAPDFPSHSAPYLSNLTGRTLDMAPGNLNQADILTSIGPVITARSDTFIIRSYGTSLSSAGDVLSESWCEMLVQRLPEGDKTDRPFRILNFRYLDLEDI